MQKITKKYEKAEDFIGWKSKDGRLEVVGIAGRDLRSIALFKVTCTECSKDPELFPDGYFISRKGELEKEKFPCGCSINYVWDEQQCLLRMKRLRDNENFTVHGFAEEFHGNKTEVTCECHIHKYKWETTVNELMSDRGNCTKCSNKYRPTEQELLFKLEEICKKHNYKLIGFPDGFKNKESKLIYVCPIHGKKFVTYNNFMYSGTRCPNCATYGYRSDKAGSFYIARWIKDSHSFIKFGITNQKVKYRLGKQKRFTDYKYNILYTKSWLDGGIPLELEKLIKESPLFNRGVIDKIDFPDGFTETIEESQLESLMIFVDNYIKRYEHE